MKQFGQYHVTQYGKAFLNGATDFEAPAVAAFESGSDGLTVQTNMLDEDCSHMLADSWLGTLRLLSDSQRDEAVAYLLRSYRQASIHWEV